MLLYCASCAEFGFSDGTGLFHKDYVKVPTLYRKIVDGAIQYYKLDLVQSGCLTRLA